MSLEEAREWGARQAQCAAESRDTTELDDDAWKAVVVRLGESAEHGSGDLEAYRAAFDRASPDQPSTKAAPEVETRPPAIATPSYLLVAPPVVAELSGCTHLGVDETAPLVFGPRAEALPFEPSSEPRPPPRSDRASSNEASTRAPFADAEMTLPPNVGAQGPDLPFKPASERASSPAAPREWPRGALELVSTAPVDGDETAFMSRDLFFGPARPFPLYRYAAFLGELSKDLTRAAELRAKYKIADETTQRAIGAEFAAAFAQDPSLRTLFDALFARAKGGP